MPGVVERGLVGGCASSRRSTTKSGSTRRWATCHHRPSSSAACWLS